MRCGERFSDGGPLAPLQQHLNETTATWRSGWISSGTLFGLSRYSIQRSLSASDSVLTTGLVRYLRTVLEPVLISTVAVMPG